MADAQSPESGRAAPRTRLGRYKFLSIVVVCLAPVVLSYMSYYVWRPEGRTNYGELLQPPPDAAELSANAGAAGELESLGSLRGKWYYLIVGPSACAQDCAGQLWKVRQVRATTGPERDRVERVWLLTDAQQPEQTLVAVHDGLRIGRINGQLAQSKLPVAEGHRLQDHIYLIDPLGNVVLRYGKDADPSRMKRDIAKLLKASRIG